jgi:predicted 3-demethylubiquinone-9 3-methyltransferase (glyoxalase superfamily)
VPGVEPGNERSVGRPPHHNEEQTMTQKITPYLWFDNQAEAAMNYYVSVFKDAEVLSVSRYGEAGPGPAGSVMTASFRLNGQEFIALNGGPQFTFTEAISFLIECTTQEDVDYYWDKLTVGGEPGPCGWLKDQFGLSWQVIPTVLFELLQDKDPAKANRVMQAMFQMTKIEIAKLKDAYDQE